VQAPPFVRSDRGAPLPGAPRCAGAPRWLTLLGQRGALWGRALSRLRELGRAEGKNTQAQTPRPRSTSYPAPPRCEGGPRWLTLPGQRGALWGRALSQRTLGAGPSGVLGAEDLIDQLAAVGALAQLVLALRQGRPRHLASAVVLAELVVQLAAWPR